MYVSYINNIGHRNNYFYMQVLQGSCVGTGNKQLLQTVAPNRDNFLDKHFIKKELVINKPEVNKHVRTVQRPSSFLVSDICWMWTSSQCIPAQLFQESVLRDPGN